VVLGLTFKPADEIEIKRRVLLLVSCPRSHVEERNWKLDTTDQ